MIQRRSLSVSLFVVYRDGLLVAAFRTLEDAADYEDHLEAEAAILEDADTEAHPIGDAAADAVTVNLFAGTVL